MDYFSHGRPCLWSPMASEITPQVGVRCTTIGQESSTSTVFELEQVTTAEDGTLIQDGICLLYSGIVSPTRKIPRVALSDRTLFNKGVLVWIESYRYDPYRRRVYIISKATCEGAETKHTTYNRDGKVTSKGFKKDGVEVGWWTYHESAGRLLKQRCKYVNGMVVRKLIYWSNGRLKIRRSYNLESGALTGWGTDWDSTGHRIRKTFYSHRRTTQ